MSRSVWIRFAAVAVVMITAVGCPSGSDESGNRDTAPPVVSQNTPEQPEIKPAEPPALVEPPAVPPASAEPVEPNPPLGSNVGPQPNPLRNGVQPAEVDPPVPDVSDPAATDLSDPLPANPKAPSDPPAEEKFDPIKENGAIFVDWPRQARLALVITGRQAGYIEPCGCAGLDRMKGGMTRRHTMLKQLRQKGWPVVAIDVGGLAKGYGRQAVLKFHTMVEGMRKMGYTAIALGTAELQLPTGELAADAASVQGQPSVFISANAAMFGFATNMTAKTRIVEAGGVKLGITAVLGKQFQRELQGPDTIETHTIELADPEPALAAVLPQLKQNADYLILLAHATMQESIDLARKFPDFDVVVTAGGAPTPPADLTKVPGSKTLLIEVGEKGQDAIVLAFFDDPKKPLRYQRVPLDSRFPASREMVLLMGLYQDQLKREWLSRFAVGKIPHEQADLLGKFVGSEECKSCHEESYLVWKKSGHAKAYATLADLTVAGVKVPRTYDPECISCHVIGWHSQEHFPYQTGFVTLEGTPKLIDVGCESCHGPGGAHAAAEQGADLALQEQLQKALVITKKESEKRQCRTCHDLDNSPHFDFETYWPKVEHYEDVERGERGEKEKKKN